MGYKALKHIAFGRILKLGMLLFFNSIFNFNNIVANPISPKQMAANYVLSNNPWLVQNENTIALFSERESEMGFHFYFVQKHQSIEVFQAGIKVNVDKKGNLLSVFNRLKPIYKVLPAYSINLSQANESKVYFLNNDNWVQAKKIKTPNTMGEMEERVLSEKGELLNYRMLDLFVRKDTLVQTKVFNPDPLSSAQKSYGLDGLWKNNGGADSPELTAERKVVNVTLGISNDTFYASSPYAIISDLESPAQTPFSSKLSSFDFTRSQSEFREMNCLYHMEQIRKYLNSIGIPLSDMSPILVDPTAYQGQDQSRFSFSNGDKPSLFFGTGGVPDAEDADVIIHEYMHGLTNFIAPSSTSGDERLAVEEANCDFMACQYSKSITDFNWRWVFNWDGHNEFWNGRNANSSNKYPDDLSSDFYVSSLIWSSMLNDIGEDLGRAVITKLLFNSIYSYADGLSMQETADLLLQADSVLYGYAHFAPLKTRLVQRGFDVYTGINEQAKSQRNFSLINSEGFALGTGNLSIQFDGKGEIKAEVYNSQGQQLETVYSLNQELVLKPDNYKIGVYFLRLSNDSGQVYTEKLLRSK